METVKNHPKNVYLSMPINDRINFKEQGCIFNPALSTNYSNENLISRPYKIIGISGNSIGYLFQDVPTWTGAPTIWFNESTYTGQFQTKRNFVLRRKQHSLYPANSFEMLGLGRCNR